MAISTALVGPYDRIPTHEKTRAQVGIPTPIYIELFHNLLIFRGGQDKILARLFYTFQTILSVHYPNLFDYSLDEREEIVNHVLNLS